MSFVLFTPTNKGLMYETKISTYNKDAKKESRELVYTTNVKKLGDTFSGYHIVNFKRSNLILDNTKFHNSINEIIILFGKIFEDINLNIKPNGEIKGINNFEEIQDKWKSEIKYKVSKTYKGALVESMIANIDSKMNKESLFTESLYKDPFFFTYILSINGEYINNILYCKRTLDNFGGINNIEVKYKFKLNDELPNNRIITGIGFIENKEKAILIENNPILDIDYSYNSHYELDAQKCIKAISASQYLMIDQKMTMKQDIFTNLIL